MSQDTVILDNDGRHLLVNEFIDELQNAAAKDKMKNMIEGLAEEVRDISTRMDKVTKVLMIESRSNSDGPIVDLLPRLERSSRDVDAVDAGLERTRRASERPA